MFTNVSKPRETVSKGKVPWKPLELFLETKFTHEKGLQALSLYSFRVFSLDKLKKNENTVFEITIP